MLRGWAALTGTPGVGKTTVGRELAYRGIRRVDLGEFATEHDLAEGTDEARDSRIVDPKRVADALRLLAQKDERIVLEGHWAHDVPGVVGAVVLRLNPRDLRARLVARKWPPAKVEENVEAEAIDLILQEAVTRLGEPNVFEVDGTGRTPEVIAVDVHRILTREPVEARFRPGGTDWSGELTQGT